MEAGRPAALAPTVAAARTRASPGRGCRDRGDCDAPAPADDFACRRLAADGEGASIAGPPSRIRSSGSTPTATPSGKERTLALNCSPARDESQRSAKCAALASGSTDVTPEPLGRRQICRGHCLLCSVGPPGIARGVDGSVAEVVLSPGPMVGPGGGSS